MSYKPVNTRDLSIFCSQMSMVLQAGISFMEAVPLLREQTESKALQAGLKEIEAQMETGLSFADASKDLPDAVFPRYMKSMLVIGDVSGSMDVVFDRLAEYYDKDSKLRRRVRSAITYPIILTILMLAMVFLLLVKILPMFGEILTSMGGDVPALTRALLNFSGFMSRNWLYVIICFVVIIAGLVWWSRTEKGRYQIHGMQLSFPVARSIFPKIITARFSRSLAILLKSGVGLLSALELMDHMIGNLKVEERFIQARQDIGDGEDLIPAMTKIKVFPPLFLRLIGIGQKTGFLDEMLIKSAGIFDEEVDESLQRMTNLLEPIIIIILSVVVGIILLSVMLPMISIMNSIG